MSVANVMIYLLFASYVFVCAIDFKDAADKISVTVTLKHELKPMSQSGYCFRSMYSNGNSNKLICKITDFNRLKFALQTSLLLLLFSDYVDLRATADKISVMAILQ